MLVLAFSGPDPAYQIPSSYPSPSPFWYNPMTPLYTIISSSDPSEELEICDIYTMVVQWLTEFDKGHWGRDNQNFTQYANNLTSNGFIHIDNLLNGVNSEILIKICLGIPLGVALNILKYTEKDVHKIQRSQRRQLQNTF